ncbi:MAG: transcriptional regulator [Candidatus Thorarchaeota archaeon]|jgi:putative transcriptional regulator
MSVQSSARERLARRIAGEIAMSGNPGAIMKVWRERFRLPQIHLADFLDISPSVISDYESGRRKSPGTSTIRRFVLALLTLDERSGGTIIAAFVRLMDVSLVDLNIVLAMSDFHSSMTSRDFCTKLKCDVLSGEDYLDKEIYGYTLVDVERAVKDLDSEAFMKLFGATTERCLIFTNSHSGRAPMFAIKSQEFKPRLVILHGTGEIDKLALELSETMHIPLAVSKIKTIDGLVKQLRSSDLD